ncbi:5253_t:CDS:2 [Acaulospora colombiana]|uniref:5253_t:CDS:1 n=1 Tax=Acaulospora colombiana TaxID=27376 RepID=A0ACA9N1H0_9GLOM|nr:5253_t:CDS:2 [Acaulospora colombiana]
MCEACWRRRIKAFALDTRQDSAQLTPSINTMGASSSTLDPRGPSPPSKALHVLRVSPGSPAAQTDIEPFFDFVVGIDGDDSTSRVDAATLSRVVEQHEGKTLPLMIWSAKYRNMRDWSQTSNSNPPNNPPSLLGLSMRLCSPEAALDDVWHILEVLENSPAESAGLVPYGDWILGWPGGSLSGENAFYELVEAHIDKPLRVIVYSYDFDAMREVVLVPNRKWGGEGLLGCGVGYGLLHRIPPQPVNSDAMDTILKQNIPYDEQDAFKEPHQNGQLDQSALFVPADEDNFEFGGTSGYPKAFEEQDKPTTQEEFDETPVAHWHTVNSKPNQVPPVSNTMESHSQWYWEARASTKTEFATYRNSSKPTPYEGWHSPFTL